ncbi:hypothetical protein ZIOFF_030813 [Zingiber officinale]|uniref:VHS domain-containing protein n=1 Tax=Zingiber officinale TaxID=94328 RepID=A0A8J5LC12_ZINOF|nr:hypothetical protein ZIOFF_030813 [Zingiber officinale]
MDQSRRAVEAYWRSRMVDGVTSDEDKVAPVYKLEEICDLLRTSPVGIVKEVSDYIFKRLDHKSPIVKQKLSALEIYKPVASLMDIFILYLTLGKALRLIKYAVGKSGNEFRREMQRHSTVIRQLFHYKGELDPLKADALNKAVRETAHEAVAAVFASDENKSVTPVEGLNRRIQGFGNTNFELPAEEKRSFISEVVGLGSATIKHGLSTFAAAHSSRKDDTGSYRSPNLRRSLTTEIDSRDDYQGIEQQTENWNASRASGRNSGAWGSNSRLNVPTAAGSEDTSSSNGGVKNREERLLETIVTSGGVRLQPTRDALQVFLTEAAKLDGLAMSHALEMKLNSHIWQVRMKAICVLESILRKADDEQFIIIVSYFTENKESVIKCTELPQASLREKAIKVLNLLGDELTSGAREELPEQKSAHVPVVHIPDLIDTGDLDDYGSQDTMEKHNEKSTLTNSMGPLGDDLFGIDPVVNVSTAGSSNQDDPFSDVSFHVTEDKEQNDLFSGLTIDNQKPDVAPEGKEPDPFDVFGSTSVHFQEKASKDTGNLHDLMDGLTIQESKQHGVVNASESTFSGLDFLNHNGQPSPVSVDAAMKETLGLNAVYSQASMQFGMPSNVMFNQGFVPQPMDYNAMNAIIAQQQFLLQNLGHLNPGFSHNTRAAVMEGNPMPLPDIFQHTNNPVLNNASMLKSPKEDTRAFDFVSVTVLP